MKEIRIHARAGQGAITTAGILGYAYFSKGQFPYAFPHFGAARMGAPMNAFVRIDDKPVRLRSQVYQPDYLIIVDATLMRGFDCYVGFKDDGIAVVNEREGMDIPKPRGKQKVYVVPGNKISTDIMGKTLLGNTVLLGAYAAATGQLTLEDLKKAISERFADKGQKIVDMNAEALKRGFEFVKG
ncbi:MAG: 2-oxoacid:acceptor oxidoreductase family protein [Candidatus Omnitrophica bacterium]|nr:2-oxoacid:acceptor oxidoreductase family protein [Candidatus Omnitrophota bacterium]MDD5574086.1 2-oxoacid:acceptor oxidoreductase family protein [Candidatus Omnitrophota bacterium]